MPKSVKYFRFEHIFYMYQMGIYGIIIYLYPINLGLRKSSLV